MGDKLQALKKKYPTLSEAALLDIMAHAVKGMLTKQQVVDTVLKVALAKKAKDYHDADRVEKEAFSDCYLAIVQEFQRGE